MAVPQAQDEQGIGGAVLARFVADAPTATLQRLKALLTGGLPTFFDISRSFSAGTLTEDNLLHQLTPQGKRVVSLLKVVVDILPAAVQACPDSSFACMACSAFPCVSGI